MEQQLLTSKLNGQMDERNGWINELLQHLKTFSWDTIKLVARNDTKKKREKIKIDAVLEMTRR